MRLRQMSDHYAIYMSDCCCYAPLRRDEMMPIIYAALFDATIR